MASYLFKSREIDGIRHRALRMKEKDRWEFHGLQMLKNGKFYFDYIYTLEQAITKNIYFREDWRNPKPDAEKVYFGENVYCQENDWVLTEYPDSNGELWVMRVLWRNDHKSFPHIKTAVGTFCIIDRHNKNKPFTGDDIKSQYSMNGKTEYSGSFVNQRQELLIIKIAKLILETGYFSKEIIRVAYRTVYSVYPNWQKVIKIMKSDKIMSGVAKELRDKLADKNINLDWVAEQLKEMGEKDYDKAPDRRLEVVKLIARVHENSIEDAITPLMAENNRAIETAEYEVQEDLDKIGIDN